MGLINARNILVFRFVFQTIDVILEEFNCKTAQFQNFKNFQGKSMQVSDR